MTTATRPTFEPARGGRDRGERDLSALSKQYSSRDLPSHKQLKYRDHGQSTIEELVNRDFRRELEDRERADARDKQTSGSRGDNNTTDESEGSSSSKYEEIVPANLDNDDAQDDDDDNSEDDSDDEVMLFAELERIRRERAEEEARKQEKRQEQEERIRMENIISGNPLLDLAAPKADMKVKRRWDDDVVFKNCAASEPDKSGKKFINDTLRSDFHKRFMDKYII